MLVEKECEMFLLIHLQDLVQRQYPLFTATSVPIHSTANFCTITLSVAVFPLHLTLFPAAMYDSSCTTNLK